MANEAAERIKQLVDELRVVIDASPDRMSAKIYAKALLDGIQACPPLTAEQLKAAYAHKGPGDDPSSWDNFNPADYTITADEFMVMLRADAQAGGGGQ